MAEFKLERFKYNWKGVWSTSTSYKRDDVVRVNGKSYVCIVTHSSSSTFKADLTAILIGSSPPQAEPRWTVMTSGVTFVGNYAQGTDYNLGDIVRYDGVLWTCVFSHNATGNPAEVSYWELFADTIADLGDWQPSQYYGPGAVVKYNGIRYKCVTMNLSGTTLEEDLSSWVVYYEGVEYLSTWAPTTNYRKNDLVKYGASIFRCTETHTSNSTNLDDSFFSIEIFGTQYNATWNSSIYYNIGDIVRHRGFMYYAIQNSIDSVPFQDSPTNENWIVLAKSYYFAGEWAVTSEYRTGDVVLRGGYLYLAIRDIGANSQDGSSADYLDDNTWELLIPGKSFKYQWTAEVVYSLGDVVYFKGSAYTCNFEHEAAIINFPGDNGSGYNYWDILIQGGQEAALQNKGDLLTYGISRNIDGIADTSTLGSTNIPIGEDEQILSISSDLEAYWRDITVDADSIYVSKNGIDDVNRGTFEQPFRTIRYACEYVEDTFAPLTPVVVRPSAGRFEEIGPITIPAGCAVNGDELRSTQVIATLPIPEYENDLQYVRQYLLHFETILLDVLLGNKINPSQGNTFTQITLENYSEVSTLIDYPTKFVTGSVINPITGINEPVESNTLDTYPASTVNGASAFINLYTEYLEYISFRVESADSTPALSGSNILISDSDFLNASNVLVLNKQFLINELLAYVKLQNPSIIFTDERVKGDIWALFRGLIRDVRFSGNYETLNAARRYANAVLGSQLDDLFLVRDTTGLRDMTTGGLVGTLNPPRVFELYQRPTGGACIALDPGWGPADERTWIKNRSPYIQGVTNTGTACIGKKIDGALHNGGNRSMVSNDFTQVLSDGIGCWVTNNARAELVSVFTYYCQIGYFAENGGTIRATNGNNSYGSYGAVADGSDETETPQNATIMNRNNEAQIESAFAGGNTDRIFAFEYTHCGEKYSQASANIVGAGANAEVEYTDFRNSAIYEARLTEAVGDSGTKGGSGYLIRQGSAQETLNAASFIKLSVNDVTQTVDELLGMRLLITDGAGVGQYGYIDTFNFVNKQVGILRESDGAAGWDHIIPGTPLVTNLDLTTRYRIEPRLEVSHPGFTNATSTNLFANRTYVGLENENTKETFTNLSGASSIPWIDDNSNPVTVNSSISNISLQLNGVFANNPEVPITIQGDTSGAIAIVTAITANGVALIEVDVDTNGNSFVGNESLTIVLVAGTGDTFDDAPIAATFNIVRVGKSYSVTVSTPGAGYKTGDKITIIGTRLSGATPTNDLVITVATVSDDSTAGIETFTFAGQARGKRFVALTNAEYVQYSDNGLDWTESSLPFIGDYRALIAAKTGRFIAVANNTNQISYSLNGQDWSIGSLPITASWTDGVYGNGKYVLVADDTNQVLISSDGTAWSTVNIPDDTGGDESSISQWSKITHGRGTYVAVSANDRATATSTDGGTTWTRNDEVLPDLSPDLDIVSLVYGDNRFIVLDNVGRTSYSFDGVTWYPGTTAPQFSSGAAGSSKYTKMKFANGVFFAICLDGTGATTACATTEDGLIWIERAFSNPVRAGDITYGVISDTGTWVSLANALQSNAVQHVVTGKQAKFRSNVLQGKFSSIKIWDPGSGYANTPTLTVTDPNANTNIAPTLRLGNGILSQPDFINSGSGYRTSTSTIAITGDGYADIIPESTTIVLAGIVSLPGPGVQIRISQVMNLDTEDDVTDLKVFSGVEITDLGDDNSGNGTKLVSFTLSPGLKSEYSVEHGTNVTLRERYSQCRITGHDFLDIGTGGFVKTNYPTIYSGGKFFTASPENEVLETNGGRAYYTSTDQDGNFRTGELFAVQQSTGIVTISAQFFDLDGLSEIALGGVRLGGSGTVVNEFSTDTSFAADSNNIIPTQRAIGSFLANRLSVGGENLEVNRLVAGRVGVGGEANSIENVTGEYTILPVTTNISGTYTDENEVVRPVAIQGTIVSQMMFVKQFDETMQ
tara:strand:- start:2990 stop:8869 length:5880 start_codon:yes stop_codon:yes gene_type:complete